VSMGPEYALVGENGPEAHVLLKGGKIPVSITGGGMSPTVNITMENPTFMNQETLRASMFEVAAVAVNELAPGAVVNSYLNDGPIRGVVRRRM